ncbi:MAG: T9SS type A sorting domain-containing protein [Flavobacteriales bacterium]|nr:MAG: T9SS type A sorting domain-containing protein [Flavobacteriales bacterium]
MKISTKKTFFFLLLILFASVCTTQAQVSITRPTGGQNISNNLSRGSTIANYTPIGDIVIQETAPGDFAANPNLRVFTIARPSLNWEFRTSGVTVEVISPNNELINVSVLQSTERIIKIQYRVPNPTTGGNKITIKGIALQSLNRSLTNQNGNVYVYSDPVDDGARGVIRGITHGASGAPATTKLAPVSKVVGAAYQLLALMPGQTLATSTTTGKNTENVTPTPIAGDFVNVKVYVTDYGWYPVASSAEVTLASNDNYAVFPVGQNTLNGTLSGTDFSVQLRTATSLVDRTILLTDNANVIAPSITSSTSVNASVYTKLLAVFPEETYAPGSANGKIGVALAPQVGIPYVSTIYGVDEFWNKASVPNPTSVQFNVTNVTNFTPVLAANFSNSGATASSQTFSLVFNTVGEVPNVTAVDNTDGTKTPYNQILPAVAPNPFSKLQILLPGEVAAPGTITGKTGSPVAQSAGVPFDVTVNAVDNNWNLVTNITDVISITHSTTSDAATSLLPANAALTGGTGTFSVTLRRAASDHQLVATNITDSAKEPVTSASVAIMPGIFAKFLITLSGEDYLPGTTTGKGNTVATISVDEITIPTVRAVDAYWNLVTTETGTTVALSSSDLNAVIPSSENIDLSGSAIFSDFQFKTLGSRTITTTSDTDPTKTYTTDPINVTAGEFARLVLVMPGETAVEGIPDGKSGSADPQIAGQSFPVFIKAIDANGNTVTTANNLVTFAGDSYAQLPPNTSLANGVLNATATYRVAGNNKLLEVRDVASAISGSVQFDVNVGPYAGLLITFPNGQTYVPGSPTGNIEPIPNQGINSAFDIVVRAVDAAYNLITSVNGEVAITSNDLSGVMPPNGMLVNGISGSLSVRLNSTSTSTTLTATSMIDATKNYTTGSITVLSPSTSNDYFRSAKITGAWANSSSWESSATGGAGTWQASTRVPDTQARGITVGNGHTISTIDLIIDDVIIENGGVLNHTAGTLTIDDGAATNDFIVQGILRSAGTITKNGTLQVASNGKYQHNYTTTSGTIPAAVWETGSTCEIIGFTSYAGNVTGSDQTFSNFIWNASNQTAAGSPSLLSGFTARDFTVTSTGLGSLNLGSVGGTTTITRDYTQNAGTVRGSKTSGTQNLNFGGDFLISGGTFALGNGAVNFDFNGGSQSLENAGTAIEFQNVNFSGGTKTLTSGSFAIATTGVLTMAANTILNANGNLTILSSATSSGMVAAIPASSSIAGNVKVQRFITGGAQSPYRTYRMISSPIYDNGNPFAGTYSYSQFIDDILITGNGGSGSGFDDSPFNNASAWVYTPGASPALQDVTNINTSLDAGKSAYIYYRGNRSNLTDKFTAPYVDPEDVVMDFDGVLNQHNVVVNLANSGNLVGNPYASSIDWNSAGIIKSGGLSNIIRIWNPASRSYATYDGSIGVPSGVASNIIPAGQGFFVQTVGGGTLTFTEDAKVSAQASPLLMSTPNNEKLIVQKLAVNGGTSTLAVPATELRLTLSLNGSVFTEETAVIFKSGKSGAYNAAEDASYIHNYSTQDGGQKVFLSSRSTDNRDLVINYMPEITESTSVKLNINAFNEAGDYKLKVAYKDVPSGYNVKLNDAFLGTSTVVQNGDLHSFSVDKTQSESFGFDRFSVSFEAPTTLPVTYNSFDVAKVSEGVLVKWSTQTETNNNRFEVQRASDDKAFIKLHTELAKGNNSSYSFIDKNPLLGNNYYRLVQIDNDNKQTPNVPQVINYTGELNGGNDIVSVFPNPVVAKFTVKYNGALKANQQTLRIVNTTGQVLLTKTVSKAELINGYDINIPSYATGVYMVEVYESGNQRIGQVKLIKR